MVTNSQVYYATDFITAAKRFVPQAAGTDKATITLKCSLLLNSSFNLIVTLIYFVNFLFRPLKTYYVKSNRQVD